MHSDPDQAATHVTHEHAGTFAFVDRVALMSGDRVHHFTDPNRPSLSVKRTPSTDCKTLPEHGWDKSVRRYADSCCVCLHSAVVSGVATPGGSLMADTNKHTADSAPDRARTTKRSTIGFPYVPLGSAMRVPTVIHERYGTQCDLAQLAAGLDSTLTSSRFRTVIAAAKMFKLIETHGKQVQLTDLGAAIVDPASADEAMVDAFFAVPLFRAVYDRFEGRVLPPGPGLEGEMSSLGVTSRSVARARQILQRSAETAGFFGTDPGRLVRPPRRDPEVSAQRSDSAAVPLADTVRSRANPVVESSGPDDELLVALWSKLPPNGEFPEFQRAQWLKMVELALDMVYGTLPTVPVDAEAPG